MVTIIILGVFILCIILLKIIAVRDSELNYETVGSFIINDIYRLVLLEDINKHRRKYIGNVPINIKELLLMWSCYEISTEELKKALVV